MLIRVNKAWSSGVVLGLGELPVPLASKNNSSTSSSKAHHVGTWQAVSCRTWWGASETSLIAVFQSQLVFSPTDASFINVLVSVELARCSRTAAWLGISS